MNILEMEDMVKGLPDQVLRQYAQFPDPQIPQFLALSEVQRREDMRQRFQSQQQGMEPTVKDQILQGGIASAAPQEAPPMDQGMAPPMAPQGPMGPEMGPPQGPVMAYRGGMMPYTMSDGGMVPGGIVRMQQGRTVPYSYEMLTPSQRVRMAQVLKKLGMSSTGGLDAVSFNRLPVDKRERLFSALASELQGIGGFFSPVESIQSTLGMLDSGVGDMPAAPAVRPTSNVENAPATTQSRYLNPPVKSEVEKEQALAEFRRVTGRDSGPVAAPAVATAAAPPPMEAALVSQTVTPTPTTVSPSPDVSPLDEGIGSVPTDTETTSEFQNRLNQTLSSLPQIMGQLQQGVPPSGFSMSDLQAFAPTPFDNSESVARKEALIKQIQDTARIRKEEDIAAAEKYRSESEEPIKQLREEARRSAMASALMRLGAGIASGDMAAGLSGASESVENIMTRAREQASAERRAAKQEFRQAEREATRGERSMADTVFQMQAQQITDDENEQRNFARDQKQFAQWAFGMMRDQGKEARQAYTDSLRLSIGVSNAINQTLREEARDKRISENQFLSTFGAVYGRILEVVMERGDTELSPEKIVEMAREQTRQQLAAEGFISPKSGFALKVGDERDGYRYKGGDPSKETSWEKI